MLSDSKTATPAFQQGDFVTLAEGFLRNQEELEMKRRLCLALVLSYSLLGFCGVPWFLGGWTKDGIYPFQHSSLELRPILIASMGPRRENKPALSTAHQTKLLWHGILLMEIFQQAPIPLQLNSVNDIKDLRTLAIKEYESIDWKENERYEQCVMDCLSGSMLDRTNDQVDLDEMFALHFSERIINPLEMDVRAIWGDADPDEIISTTQLRVRGTFPDQKLDLSEPKVEMGRTKSSKLRGPGPRQPKPEKLKVSILHSNHFLAF